MIDNNNFIIGNIIRVLWHTRLHKISNYNYGHMAVSFDEDNYIIQEKLEFRDTNDNITDTFSYTILNQTMQPNKNYAMVTIDKYGKIYVRNFFDSKHPDGFNQKNTYLPDNNNEKFMMSDENEVLLNYIKLGCPDVTSIKINHGLLYFCVEYNINDELNLNLLNYCILLENKYNQLDNRLKDIEQKINKDDKEGSSKSWYFKFQLF